jgi:hypothetical protein
MPRWRFSKLHNATEVAMHIARTALVCLVFLLCGSIVERGESPQRQAILTSAHLLIPTAANNPGQFGAVFKTRVSIVNVTNRTYTINATLYRSGSGTIVRQITMGSQQARNYNNFLQDVFSYSGAAGVELDAVAPPGGSDLNQFAVFAEVYNDGANGVYKTVVNIADPSDGLSLTDPSITPGIFVDGSARTNVGCLNTATTQAIVNVDVYSSSGGLLTTHFLTVPAGGWAQNGILQDVSGGYLIWRLQFGASPNCFAVVVDNQTNDGSFIPPSKFVN